MNETLQVLKSRRSCRKFTDQKLDPETLAEILEAGTWAPTGRNRQSPLIVMVQDEETLAELDALNAKARGRGETHAFFGAPAVAVVFADSESHTGLQDASLVMGNLMNAAHSCGVGSCWLNRARDVFEMEEGRALMKKWGVPDNYVGFANCILGYPSGNLPAPRPRKEGYIIYI